MCGDVEWGNRNETRRSALHGFRRPIQRNKACLIPFTAGDFIYIALADMLPELHRTARRGTILWQFLIILAGIALMWGLKAGFEH